MLCMVIKNAYRYTADSIVGATTGWHIARSCTEPGGSRGPGFVGEIVESWDRSRRHTARLLRWTLTAFAGHLTRAGAAQRKFGTTPKSLLFGQLAS